MCRVCAYLLQLEAVAADYGIAGGVPATKSRRASSSKSKATDTTVSGYSYSDLLRYEDQQNALNPTILEAGGGAGAVTLGKCYNTNMSMHVYTCT